MARSASQTTGRFLLRAVFAAPPGRCGRLLTVAELAEPLPDDHGSSGCRGRGASPFYWYLQVLRTAVYESGSEQHKASSWAAIGDTSGVIANTQPLVRLP